jgi:hypothetical protein
MPAPFSSLDPTAKSGEKKPADHRGTPPEIRIEIFSRIAEVTGVN